jgi:hypothetical protein
VRGEGRREEERGGERRLSIAEGHARVVLLLFPLCEKIFVHPFYIRDDP